MKISIVAIGRIKEDWLKQGIAEYTKRISKFSDIEIIEIADAPEKNSVEKAIAEEGEKILSRLRDNELVIALDLKGEPLNSLQFAKKVPQWMEMGGARITFLIAGSNGYLPEVLERATARICLSNMTFPHQIARLILVEQLFRAFKITNGEKYHK